MHVCVCIPQMFLVALSSVYFAKAFQGSYMKSSITQIERRFDIPSSLIGVIDGSFELGRNSNQCVNAPEYYKQSMFCSPKKYLDILN